MTDEPQDATGYIFEQNRRWLIGLFAVGILAFHLLPGIIATWDAADGHLGWVGWSAGILHQAADSILHLLIIAGTTVAATSLVELVTRARLAEAQTKEDDRHPVM